MVWDDVAMVGQARIGDIVRRGLAEERAEHDEKARRDRSATPPNAMIGDYWWSHPRFALNTWTTGPWGAVPAIELGGLLEGGGEETGATLGHLGIDPPAPVAVDRFGLASPNPPELRHHYEDL